MAKARLYFDGDNTYIEKQARIYKMVDEIGDKIDNIPGVVNNLSSTSETDALSAAMGKELQDQINAMSGNFHFLSSWDCTTGLPGSDPATDPYVYQSGDYYIVSNTGSTNYKPHGSSYTHGVASTAVETQPVQMNDWYVYDGSTWILQPSGGAQIVVDSSLSTTSTNPVENRVITQALNNKQNTISNLSAIESGAAAGATALQPGANITQLTNNAGYQTAGDVASAISGKQDTLTAGEGIAINNNIITNTGITCLTGGTDIEVVQGGTHGLPTGYTELEHISLFGSQYIPTGLSYASGHTYSVHQRILFETSTNNNRGSGWNAGGAIYITGTTMGDGSLNSNLGPTGGVADISIEIGNGTSNYTIVTGGVTRISSRANTVLSDYAGMNYPLGAMSGTGGTTQSGSNMIGSVYFFEYTDGNNRGEYYPAKRDSDDALGMYDVVGGTFYPVIGTGAVAGPEAEDCTTVNFTNASGYVTINDVNVKVFNLSSTSDLTTAQAAYNFGASGGVPIIRYSGETFIPHTATFTGGNVPFWAPTTYGNGSSYTTVDAKQLYLYVSNGTVIQVNRYGYTSNTLSAGKDYATPYTPQYDGSPATKKYVDSKLYVGTTAPSNPTAGQLWYDTTNSKLKVYNGSAWEEVGSGGGGGSTTWGNIGGILSNQTDLQDALDTKLESADIVAGDGININSIGSDLPSGYTQVAYLQSSGSAVINTDITGIGKKIVSTTNSDVSQTSVQIFTGYNSDYLGTFIGVYSNRWCAQNASGGRIEGVDANTVQDLTIAFTLTGGLNKSEVTIGQSTGTFTRTAARPDGNLGIFGTTEGGAVIGSYIGKIYSYKVYDAATDALITELIPCLNNLSVPGFYDTANDTFYSKSAGTGTISAGPAVQAEGLKISVDDSVWTNDNVEAGTGITIDTGTSARLPSGYTELEWIQSDANCAIDSGILITQMDRVEFVGNFVENAGGFKCVVGCDDQNATQALGKYGVLFGEGTDGVYYTQAAVKNSIDVYTYSSATPDTNEHTFQTYYSNGYLYIAVDNTIDSVQGDRPTGVQDTIGIFCRHVGATDTWSSVGSKFKMKSIKMYSGSNVVFEGVPCKRDSDDEPGLYDLVNDVFLENQKSGTFTTGPVVVFDPTNVISVDPSTLPTYTAGTGIAISNNQISSTVFDLTNLTYVSLASASWTPSGTSTVPCPAGAKLAFLSWRIANSSKTVVYGAGEITIPLQASLLKTAFIGGGTSSSLFVTGGVGYDSGSNNITYTDGGSSGNLIIEYTIYFYK